MSTVQDKDDKINKQERMAMEKSFKDDVLRALNKVLFEGTKFGKSRMLSSI